MSRSRADSSPEREPASLSGTCGLYVDLQPDDQAPIAGDWIATEAGSRYLVLSSRRVERRTRHHQNVRWQLRCARLTKHIDVPDDVHVIWLRWYSRARRRR